MLGNSEVVTESIKPNIYLNTNIECVIPRTDLCHLPFAHCLMVWVSPRGLGKTAVKLRGP